MCTQLLICSAEFAPPNLHHLQRWSKLAPGCRFAPGCIFIMHRLHDQNTPQVQIYTPGVYLHRGVYCAYERGLKVPIHMVRLDDISFNEAANKTRGGAANLFSKAPDVFLEVDKLNLAVFI